MEAFIYVLNMPDAGLLHAIGIASKIYATTIRMLFYLLCSIVSEFYVNIRKGMELIASDVASSDGSQICDRFTKLIDQHAFAYRCAEQLTDCFGHFLLIEVTYIFLAVINWAMFLLDTLCSEKRDWLMEVGHLVIMIYWIVNFSVICFACHRIEDEVLKASIILSTQILLNIFLFLLNL